MKKAKGILLIIMLILSQSIFAERELSFDIKNASSGPRFLYVAGMWGGISVCSLDTITGAILSCQKAMDENNIISTPSSIVLNNAGNTVFISQGNHDSHFVSQCAINPMTGVFHSCTSTAITTPSDISADWSLISLNKDNTLAYIAVDFMENSKTKSKVLACPIVDSSIQGSCIETGANNLPQVITGLTLNRNSSTAYIEGWNFHDISSFMTVCHVDGTTFSDCILKKGGGNVSFSSRVIGSALNYSESLLYMTNSLSEIYQCSTTWNNTPAFENCSITKIDNLDPQMISRGIILNKANSLAYILFKNSSDHTSAVNVCPVVNDQLMNNCSVFTGLGDLEDATAVALAY